MEFLCIKKLNVLNFSVNETIKYSSVVPKVLHHARSISWHSTSRAWRIGRNLSDKLNTHKPTNNHELGMQEQWSRLEWRSPIMLQSTQILAHSNKFEQYPIKWAAKIDNLEIQVCNRENIYIKLWRKKANKMWN